MSKTPRTESTPDFRGDLRDPGPYNPDGRPYFDGFNPDEVPSPCYVIDRAAVEWNLRILRDVADRAGATLLLALKAFAPPPLFPFIRTYLDGACTSGVYEARLAREELGGEVHTFAPAYSNADLDTLLEISDHIIFNSLDQWLRARERCFSAAAQHGSRTFGLRINPECSLGTVALYDPCAPGSRLGITATELDRQITASGYSRDSALEGITEIHFHTLCEDDSAALEKTLEAVEHRFSEILRAPSVTCLNMGGGHHITKPGYDRDHLVSLVHETKKRYNVRVILEPGEAAAIHSGILVTTVLDLPRNVTDLAILDTSATAHMPDTLEMPYRPDVWGAGQPDDESTPERNTKITAGYTYRLGGQTCLAGDVIGDYQFSHPLKIGDRLVFDDMSHYTMVKTTTFNGIPLPSIAIWDSRSMHLELVRSPEYDDFRDPLG